jgi:hypothetical protein
LAEIRVHDLGVLVDEHQGLQVVAGRRGIEQQVVAAEDRAGGREGVHL